MAWDYFILRVKWLMQAQSNTYSDWYERKVSLLLLKTFIAILDYSFREAADFVEMCPEADRFFDLPFGYSLHRLLNRKVYNHRLNLYD